MSLNFQEKLWLDNVHKALLVKREQGTSSLTLAEIGNICPLKKNQKSKCRKLSLLVNLDNRFNVMEDDTVELSDDPNKSECADMSQSHANFFEYICTLSEEDLILCEERTGLEHHFHKWTTVTELEFDGHISKHVSTIVDDLVSRNKVAIHHKTSRYIFETYDGRIQARMSLIESTDSASTPTSSNPESILTGTDWTNVRFLDQTPFELSQLRDTKDSHRYEVRGKTYLKDKKKLYTGPSLFRMLCSEVIAVEEGDTRYDHIANMGRVRHRVELLSRIAEPPEVLVCNYQYPGSPPVCNVAIFVGPPSINVISSEDSEDVVAYKTLWRNFKDFPLTSNDDERLALFANGDGSSGWWWPSDITWGKPEEKGVFPRNDYKNQRFKLIPNVVEGNWVVRNAMPAALPCLLGQKVQQRYFRGDTYMEIDVDVGSSAIASNIISVLRGYAKHVKCEYGIILQGECGQELPERVLASQSVENVDYSHLKRIFDIPVVLAETES